MGPDLTKGVEPTHRMDLWDIKVTKKGILTPGEGASGCWGMSLSYSVLLHSVLVPCCILVSATRDFFHLWLYVPVYHFTYLVIVLGYSRTPLSFWNVLMRFLLQCFPNFSKPRHSLSVIYFPMHPNHKNKNKCLQNTCLNVICAKPCTSTASSLDYNQGFTR